MKKLLFLLLGFGLAFSQWMSNERLFLDIGTAGAPCLSGSNAAYLTEANLPYAYAFTYRYDNGGGEFRLPFQPRIKSYHNMSVSAFRKMDNGMLFGGRFAYRYEERRDKLWLHNAEDHLQIPFYFADSSTGDFALNGIDWNVLLSYPLTPKLRAGVNVFYNVDEQYKSVFPKPNVKRNNFRIRPGLAVSGKNAHVGIRGTFFQYKENMETKKYSLEQGKTPTFMRIRGLDRPVMSYAETSEERLESILGWGFSADADLGGILLLEGQYERSNADIVDGGSYPVPQGNWGLQRYYYRAELRMFGKRRAGAEFFFHQDGTHARGFHPELGERIYAGDLRRYEGGVNIPYRHSAGEVWTGTVSWAAGERKREDNFLGILYYIPASTLHIGMRYTKHGAPVDFAFSLAYETTFAGPATTFGGDTAGYYDTVTAAEIAWYARDRRNIRAEGRIAFPAGRRRLELRASWERVMPLYGGEDFHYAQTSLSWIF